MIIKALFLFSFISLTAFGSDGLGIGGGPPADIINPVIIPIMPSDSLSVRTAGQFILPNNSSTTASDGVLCKESQELWKPLLHSSEVLKRWPLENGSGCLEPLREFSKKLSLARAPLALSFATFIDGLEKHLHGGALKWKSCTQGCVVKSTVPSECIEATSLIQRITQLPSGNEKYLLNQNIWNEVSTKQPLVCAAAVVDLWLSAHVKDESKRVVMVSDFFSAKFHANRENVSQCFDPTASTRPFDSLDGQIQSILLQIN